MKNWIAWKVVLFLTTEILYWMYRGVMWLKIHKPDLPWWSLPIAYLFVAAGVIADIVYNLVIGTLWFRDWPRELFFTSRLKRYKYGTDVAPWRRTRALQICARLDPYDPSGSHC